MELSRLESTILRQISQKACLDYGINMARKVNGHVVELGLGMGYTFDHLRRSFTARQLYAFDLELFTHKKLTPFETQLRLGDIRETFPRFAKHNFQKVALLHIDIRTNNFKRDTAVYSRVEAAIEEAMAPNGIVVSDRELNLNGFKLGPPLAATQDWPYFLYIRV